MHLGFLSLHALQIYQLPAPVVGVAVGLAAGTAGVGVVPVVGSAVGLVAGVVGVEVAPVVGVGSTVGFVAGTVGVVDVPVAGLVFWFCVLVFPALKVALMATPFPSVVTATGSGVFNKPAQFSPFAP